jgi:hypothetical protein
MLFELSSLAKSLKNIWKINIDIFNVTPEISTIEKATTWSDFYIQLIGKWE